VLAPSTAAPARKVRRFISVSVGPFLFDFMSVLR
jgi:hypothetical protein